jgi:hypothetical protein
MRIARILLLSLLSIALISAPAGARVVRVQIRVDDGISSLIARRLLLADDSTAARDRMVDAWERYGLLSK